MNVHVPYTQAGRMMAISTPLGQDVLLLEHLAIDEAINGLFTIEAQVKSQRDDLKASDLIGSTVDFSLKLKDDGTRWWNGFVTSLHEGPLTSRGTRSYGITVRPKLWTLSRKSDCRIFLNQTSVQIVETLCKEHGITDLDVRITGQPPSREYSVQWNETDLDYMLRRIQQDGILYWHDQVQGKHTLVITDHVAGYRDSQEQQVRYTEGTAEQDQITRWRRKFEFIPGKRSGADWNFLTMTAPQGEQTTLDNLPGNPQEELYEFPGLFKDSTSGEQAMKYRIQATETGYETVEAASFVRTLGPGQKFTPRDVAKPDDVFAQQVVTSIRHEATDRTYETNGSRPAYDNTFTTLPAVTPATPHRTIPRPMITGTQIALIAGPDGEEIFCDQYGRIKVWFPWDRRAKKDGSDTCWLRVGQPWAGTNWGHQVIPRIGMEALILYREGDPDRPFVSAVLPDPTNPVPYTLPDNKTRMTFRSNSYKASGYNEMTLEDLGGQERYHMFSQKDQTNVVQNNLTHQVAQNAINNVGANQSLQVGANMQQNVGGGLSIAVGAVGGAVPGLISGVLSGLMGQSSGMLGEAMGIAGTAMQGAAAAAGMASAPGGGALGAAQAAVGGIASGIGGAATASNPLSALQSSVGSYASALAGLGPAITNASSAASALSGVESTASTSTDAGLSIAEAGASTASQVAGMIGPGILNQVVGMMENNSVGVAQTEQIGVAKVLSVGSVYTQQIGNQLLVNVGDQLVFQVGQQGSGSTLVMKSDGSILLQGTEIYIVGNSHIQLLTPMLDHN